MTWWRAQYPGGGVRVAGDENRGQELEATLSVLRARFDDRLLANLFRALAGCDRLASLAHLSIMNGEDRDDAPDTHRRNGMTITLHMFGTMREMAKVLDQLHGAGIKGALTDKSPWMRLDDVRRRWARQASIRMRDRIAFHLGVNDMNYTETLDVVQGRSDRNLIIHQERPTLSHRRHPIGDEILFAASDVEEEELTAVTENMATDSAKMTRDLEAIVIDFLRQCGAKL